jgi:hypothetical protein
MKLRQQQAIASSRWFLVRARSGQERIAPFDRDDGPPLGVAFPAPQPRSQIDDAFVRPEAERGQGCRVDQPAMPARGALDDDEITRP